MQLTYDLHSHSTASDGTLTPTRLVHRAARAGVQVLALTDHDTTAGLAEAAVAASEASVLLVSGVEISVTWNGMTIHVVGLGIDPAAPALDEGLKSLRRFREWRAEEISRRLANAGISDALEGARSHARGELVGRTHFARYLVECRRAATVREVFAKYLVRGRPGHVAGQWASLEDAVGWIRAAGGSAVIAHPARYKLTRTKLHRLLGEHREHGGTAMEVVSGSHSRDECFTMARYAGECGLLASVGSDYHGPENPYVEIGRLQPLPHGCRPVWQDWEIPEQFLRTIQTARAG